MPRPKKPLAERARRNNDQDLGVIIYGDSPDLDLTPSPNWTDHYQSLWATFWQQPSARAYGDANQLMGLRRLFDCYQLRSEAQRRIDADFDNKHAWSVFLRLGAEISTLESKYGLNPKGLLDLGVTFRQMQSLKALNEASGTNTAPDWDNLEGLDD